MPCLSASFSTPYWRRAVRVAVAATLSLAATAAVAQEQMIIPYACSVEGGRVALEPSRERAYRIYGEREERPYTICSPINPNICRSWLLHRFDLDCGGTRVDWLSVVEAASEQTTGRAWVENGRLRMRMNQYWGRDTASDDPCPRWRRRGRGDDDCSERRFQRPRGVVEMPAGFAPAFGLPVRFVQIDLPAALPDAPSGAGAGSPYPGKAPAAKSARIEPPREVTAKDAPGKDPPGKDPPGKLPQVTAATPGTSAGTSAGMSAGTPTAAPKTASRPVTATPADPPAEPSVPAKTKRTEPVREAAAEPVTPSGSGTSVVPKIINRPAGAESSGTGQGSSARPTIPLEAKPVEPVRPQVQVEVPAKSAAKMDEGRPVPEPVAAKRPEAADAPAGHSTLSAYTPSSTAQAIVGFAGLIAAALGLLAWTRRREQLSLAAASAREFGTVTFEGRSRDPQPTGTAVARVRPAAVSATRPPPLPTAPVAEAYMPATREEACRLLGASPDAGEAAIRKIVEGLRQSWHPDLATGEADRQLREQRTTQVNVAWEILSGKRPAA